MKEIKEFTCLHIISEPGDATRYDYIIIKNGDNYLFVPYDNEFRYPSQINKFSAINADEEGIRNIADYYKCNYYTVKECIRTIIELENQSIIKDI